LLDREPEKVFPKRQVGCFDRDELIQGVMYIRLGDLPKGFVQREIKELIENERLGELRIMRGDRYHFNIRDVVMEPDWSGLYQRQKIYRQFRVYPPMIHWIGFNT